MNHVLCLGIYSYFTSRYGVQKTNQHHQHQSKVLTQRHELKKALVEKNATKKRLRQLRRTGSDPETVRQLACEFHSLVQAHSQLSRTVKRLEQAQNQKHQRKDCRKDIHKFARRKRWCGLARSANTGCIYLSKEKGGLELPSLLTLYKKLHVSKAAAYTCSRDPVVRAIASQKTRKEATQTRPSFRPYQVVVSAMQEDSGMSSYQLSRKVKSMVEEEDATARLRYSRSLVRQNKPLNDDSRAPHVWSTTITSLPERVLSFALNSLTDTLPHNATSTCGRRSPQQHVTCVATPRPSCMF